MTNFINMKTSKYNFISYFSSSYQIWPDLLIKQRRNTTGFVLHWRYSQRTFWAQTLYAYIRLKVTLYCDWWGKEKGQGREVGERMGTSGMTRGRFRDEMRGCWMFSQCYQEKSISLYTMYLRLFKTSSN